MKTAVLVCLAALAASCSSNPDAPPAASVKVIPHEKLLDLLPALDGWTRKAEPQGTTDIAEGVSRVQVDYEPAGPDKASAVGIEIMDTSMNQNILGPLRGFIRANKTETSGSPSAPITTKPTTVAGFPASEEWLADAKNGTLNILVADRFTVGITGNYISGPEALHRVAEAMDLRKLAALK